jgi:hypothetical protein
MQILSVRGHGMTPIEKINELYAKLSAPGAVSYEFISLWGRELYQSWPAIARVLEAIDFDDLDPMHGSTERIKEAWKALEKGAHVRPAILSEDYGDKLPDQGGEKK